MEATGPLEDDQRESAAALAGSLRPAEVIPGTPGPDVLQGTPENDQIDAQGGDDVVNGRGGADEIDGGDGNDTLRGGPGGDTIDGGAGNDTIDGGGGDDRLDGGGGEDLLRGGGRNDDLRGQAGNDRLVGGAGSDVLRGGGGDDELQGGNGPDRLLGGGGDDVLIGGRGTDELRGGAGADILDSKGGTLDILVGGAGPDVFTFTVLDTGDRVLDFVQGEDRLDIGALLPDFQPGDDLDRFVQLQIVPAGTRMSIDPSGSGANFQLLASLEGVEITALTPGELGLPTPLPAEPTVVSTNADGELADDVAFAPSLSRDGQFVSFSSLAGNMVDGDENETFDIFRKDLTTGEVELITQVRVPGQGLVAANGDSFFSAISGDGSVVAFDSAAGNLSNVETGQRNVFVTTADSAEVDLVSIVGNRFATDPSISADGSLVAFTATATGDAESDDPASLDTVMPRVYVRDLTDGSLLEASSDADGDFADRPSGNPDISANGAFVAFESLANNLIGEDLNPGADVYVKSLIDGSIRIASTTSGGDQGVGSSVNSAISGDGGLVAFQSRARLTVEDTDNVNDIYLKNLDTGELSLVTINADGIKADGASFTPSISDDGRFIAFRSAASNLVDGDDNGRPDIFIADMQTNQFVRFELASDTRGANAELVGPTLSGDGALVAFVDQVTVSDGGGLLASQVWVAPVGGFGAATLDVADVLSSDPEPLAGGAAETVAGAAAPVQVSAAAGAPAGDLSTLVVQPDAA